MAERIHLYNYLVLDIETAPCVSNYNQLSEAMQNLWKRKSLQLVSANEDFEFTFFNKSGVYAEFAKIICIGLGYFVKVKNEWQYRVKTITHHDEKKVLEEFCSIVHSFFNTKSKNFAGHNIREFDIPFLCRRCLINILELPVALKKLQSIKPWENNLIDTLQLWKFGDYKHYISLDLLANILTIDSPKDDIDGSRVAEVYWNENDLQRIAKYCCKDIVTVAQIILRLHQFPLLRSEQIIYTNEE